MIKPNDFHTIDLPKTQNDSLVVLLGRVAILEAMEWLKRNWYVLVAVALLLGALGEHPYSYYQILRWVVSIAAFYRAYQFHEHDSNIWKWTMIALGILFNPIVPFYMEKETWAIFDVLGGAVLLASLFSNRK